MIKRAVIVVFLFISFFSSCPKAMGWSVFTHIYITTKAYEYIPPGVLRILGEDGSPLIAGSMAPDLVYRDFVNHVWMVHGDQTGRAPYRIQELYDETVHKVACEQGDDWEKLRTFKFNMGVLSHYLADLHQPLHTDEVVDDRYIIHVMYENRIAGEFSSSDFNFQFDGYAYLGGSITEFAIHTAEQSNAHVYDVINLYEANVFEDTQELKALAYPQLQAAVNNIIDLWISLIVDIDTQLNTPSCP